MADEVIKIIEYITGNSIVQGAFIAYIIFGIVVVSTVLAVFVFSFKTILSNRKRWK